MLWHSDTSILWAGSAVCDFPKHDRYDAKVAKHVAVSYRCDGKDKLRFYCDLHYWSYHKVDCFLESIFQRYVECLWLLYSGDKYSWNLHGPIEFQFSRAQIEFPSHQDFQNRPNVQTVQETKTTTSDLHNIYQHAFLNHECRWANVFADLYLRGDWGQLFRAYQMERPY